MSVRASRSLDRTGALAGVAAVVLLAVIVVALPAMPAPNGSPASVVADVRGSAPGLLAVGYLASLMDAALLVFGAAVAAWLRRAGDTGWATVAVVGIAATTIHFVASALSITFVRAVQHGASGPDLWLGYGGDHWLGTLVGLPLAVFLLGAAAGARALRLLPRWLTWLGLAGAVALAAGAGSVMEDELTGGVLGLALLLGYLLLFAWILSTSVIMWRRGSRVVLPAPAAVPA